MYLGSSMDIKAEEQGEFVPLSAVRKKTEDDMLTNYGQNQLGKQGYGLIGTHSSVKTCGWTKNMIKGKGGCYKLKFYGIMSNQCMQMTTSLSCANRCTFCWRGYKAPVAKEWKWGVDDPKMIFEESMKSHHKQLTGFGGNPKANKMIYEKSKDIKHVALSLTGEPIAYPRMNELIDLFHKNQVSTFLVTNGQYPEAIKNLKSITQLYLSVDAPNKDLLKEIDVPLFSDYWERMLQSLDYLSKKKGRTCIRLTMIKGMNMIEPEGYAGLIKRGDPDFVEVKGYMFVGASRQVLSLKNMPYHEEVKGWAEKELLPHLEDYELISEHTPSRVVCLAKKKFAKKTWIDFERFFELFKEDPQREYDEKEYRADRVVSY